MHHRSLFRFARYVALALACCLVAAIAARAQASSEYEQNKQKAYKLFDNHRPLDALPLLEELATQKPDDIGVLDKLCYAIFLRAATLTDPVERKKERLRARELALKIKAMGANQGLYDAVLLSPQDGSEPPFSQRGEVDEIMRKAEAAFVRGDFALAVEGYLGALALEPKCYEAALYIGDVRYKQKEYEEAGKWFARAIEIDPDRETAHRYWGDALYFSGKQDEALPMYIEAVVAEPYNRLAYHGIAYYAQQNKLRLGHPNIQSPNSVSRQGDKTTLSLDFNKLESKDGSSAWLVYDMLRTTWQSEEFQKAYPNEKTYRHSLKEELAALGVVVASLREQMPSRKVKEKDLDPALSVLLTIEQKGLLEAYILLGRADQGIAQDYEAYRKDNRDKLRRYLREYFFQAPPPGSP